MKPIIFSLFDNGSIVEAFHHDKAYEIGNITLHQFPDDESYIKINSGVKDRKVILMTSLDRPNTKLLPLLFACETIRGLGAKEIGLIAPYLAYMRQDKIFNPGEGITSKYFASLLSKYFNWLMTIDPHLHRINKLTEIYKIPTTVLHAAKPISNWIKEEINNPLIIGPDRESEQWIASIAKNVRAPYTVAEKIRRGDKEIEIFISNLESYHKCTPILVDDIISTAKTMLGTIYHLKTMKMKPPICISIHAVFAGDSYDELLKSGVEKVITCNTIQHESNAIDVTSLLMGAMKNQVINE